MALAPAALPDGRLASGGPDDTVKLWPTDGRGKRAVLDGAGWVVALAALPDGRLASSGTGGAVMLWPADGGGEPAVLVHGDTEVDALAVLPDGRLASGDYDGRVKLWPADGGGEPTVLDHGDMVFALAALPDGRLASGGADGRVKLWLVEEKSLISALCLRAGRNLTQDEWNRYIGPDQPWQPSCRDRPSNWRTPDR